MTAKPRILVVDNDYRVGNDLMEMLQSEGYTVEVVCDLGRKLVSLATDIARQLRPHVTVVDLRLINEYDTADRSGLDLLKKMESTHGILFSAHLSLDLIREISRMGNVSWISKGERPDQLLEAVRSALREDGLGPRSIRITGFSSNKIVQSLFGRETKVPPDSVHIVLHRLFPEANRIALHALPEEVVSSPAPSRRHSVVLKAQVNDLEPVAIKFASSRQIRIERSNYKHVSGRLVGQFLAKLEDTAEFWDLGAACYTFLGSSFQALPSFQNFYLAVDKPESVLKPLTHLFGEVWVKLYRKTRPCSSYKTLYQRYDHVFHIRKRLKRLDTTDGALALAGLPSPLINPLSWIPEHHDESLFSDARLAVTHGDLHAQNLFVDGEHAWTIDFERAGSGHRLRDFIELETDIATRLARFPVDDLAPYFRFAVALAALSEPGSPAYPDPVADFEAQKALSVINGIRELAYQTTGYQNPREYLWGLLLNAIFIGSLVDEQSLQRCRAFLLAAVLCERLSRWGQAWPPEEWLPLCATP